MMHSGPPPLSVTILLLLVCAAIAAAWDIPQVVFDVGPSPRGGATRPMAQPYEVFADNLAAIALVDDASSAPFACFFNPLANGGACIAGTIVWGAPGSTFAQIIAVTKQSALFVMSTSLQSLVAYVDAVDGVVWNQDRRNCTGPVAYDGFTGNVVLTYAHPAGNAVEPFDFVEALAVQQRNESLRVQWAMHLDRVDPQRAHPSQFSGAMQVLFSRVWFTYAETLYGVDLSDGPKNAASLVTVDRPCGLQTAPLPTANGCTNCTIPYTLDLLFPEGGNVGRDFSVVVSGNAWPDRRFKLCGFFVSANTNNVTQRFDISDPSEMIVAAPFVTSSLASLALGGRNRTVFYISGTVSGLMLPAHTLIAADIYTGVTVWAEFRSVVDVFSMPVELAGTGANQGGSVVAYQLLGKLVAKTIDGQQDVWRLDATMCSDTARFDRVRQRLFCVNGTFGITAVNPPPAGVNVGSVAWSQPLPVRPAGLFSNTQPFKGQAGEALIAAALANGTIAGLSVDGVPPSATTTTTTTASSVSPTPTTTGTPPPPTQPVPREPSPPGPSDDHLKPGVIALIVIVVVAAVGFAAAFGFRYWKVNKTRSRRGAIDSAMTYGDGAFETTHHRVAPVAQHAPSDGYGSLYA